MDATRARRYCLPPMFINTGTWVGEGTMIDSHAMDGKMRTGGALTAISLRGADRRRSGAGWAQPVFIGMKAGWAV